MEKYRKTIDCKKPFLYFKWFVLMSGILSGSVCQADLAVGGRLGSMGIGVDIAKQINDRFNIRIAFSGVQFDYESSEDSIEYEFELDVGATGLIVDWHPFKGSMRVTAGIYSNSTTLVGVATPTDGNYGIGDGSYSPDDIGDLTATIDLGSTAPYVGLGWGYDLSDVGIGFALDVGILVQDSPRVTISTEFSGAAELQADLDLEAAELAESLVDFQLFPVVMIGLTYTF